MKKIIMSKAEFPQRTVKVKEQQTQRPSPTHPLKKYDRKIWRDKIAFWVLGFNKQFGFSILLVAAQDILHETLPEVNYVEKMRNCRAISTGVILLMLMLTALLVQWLQSCLHHCLRNSFELLATLSMVISLSGYFLLAFGYKQILALLGVIFISIGYGIGDYELPKRCLFYKLKVARKFHRGADDALIAAPIYYTIMRLCGVKMIYIFMSLLGLPVLGILCFWFMLRPPLPPKLSEHPDSQFSLGIFNSRPLVHLEDKIRYICHLMKYIAPLGFVFIFQGIVNQGLYEFSYVRYTVIDINRQYSIYICAFNLGLYACLVTRNLLLTHIVWICTSLHLLIMAFFIFDVIFFFLGYLWCIILVVYIQGIITGVAYTSTLENMLSKEPANYLDFAEAVLRNSRYITLSISGILDFGIHYYFSRTPEPERP